MTMTPAQWLVLDNLRMKYPIDTNLPIGLAIEALQWCKEKGFADDLSGGRITRKGEIALHLSCVDGGVNNVVEQV
jgi:hypothetical protein